MKEAEFRSWLQKVAAKHPTALAAALSELDADIDPFQYRTSVASLPDEYFVYFFALMRLIQWWPGQRKFLPLPCWLTGRRFPAVLRVAIIRNSNFCRRICGYVSRIGWCWACFHVVGKDGTCRCLRPGMATVICV